MIDPENQVFSTIYDALMATDEHNEPLFPGLNVTGEYVREPSSLPHASITMSDNYVARGRQASNNAEILANYMFEVNVYSNKKNGKKSECKAILQVIDDVMFSLNLQRISMSPVPNLEDATIYRIVARYSGASDGTYFHRS